MRTIGKPFSMQLELTAGCNRRCYFCGIHDMAIDEFHYMTLELAQEVAKQLVGWKPKIRMEFGTGGEPTLNPQFFEIVAALRQGDPQIQIMCQSNVEPWEDRAVDWINEFYKAGGNYIVLNCYKKGLRERMLADLAGKLKFIDFYHDNPDHVTFYHYKSPKEQLVFICEDLGFASETHLTAKVSPRWINNQGGSTPHTAYSRLNKPLPRLPLQKKCSRVFREMVISWDGRVPPCCYDWLDRLTTGKFPEQGLQEIWEGGTFQNARQLLFHKNRNFDPCKTCDYNGGFRLGFLKDPDTGKTDEIAFQEIDAVREIQNKTWSPVQLKGILRANRWLTAGSKEEK